MMRTRAIMATVTCMLGIAAVVTTVAGQLSGRSHDMAVLNSDVLAHAPTTLPAAGVSGRIAHFAQLSVETLPGGHCTLRLTVIQGDRRELREVAFELID
jgi:hypothetical protein